MRPSQSDDARDEVGGEDVEGVVDLGGAEEGVPRPDVKQRGDGRRDGQDGRWVVGVCAGTDADEPWKRERGAWDVILHNWFLMRYTLCEIF